MLEARMLLREMLEMKLDTIKPIIVPDLPPPKPKLSAAAVELRRLLAINPDDEDDETDLSAQIAELRKQLVVQVRENQNVEKELGVLEKKITLLIMNRSSIAELDRNAKKKRKKTTPPLTTTTSSSPTK